MRGRVGRHLQDVRVCRIYEGIDEIMKLKIATALPGRNSRRSSEVGEVAVGLSFDRRDA